MGPKEEFWKLENTFLSRKICDKKLQDSKLSIHQGHKAVNLARKDSTQPKREKSGVITAQGLWQHTLLKVAETNLEILSLGVTFLQRRRTPILFPKNYPLTLKHNLTWWLVRYTIPQWMSSSRSGSNLEIGRIRNVRLVCRIGEESGLCKVIFYQEQ